MAQTKRKPLSASLDEGNEAQQSATVPPAANTPAATSTRQKDRIGKKNISSWMPEEVAYALEELRLQRARELGRRVTLRDLHAEAFNDLFKKYGRPELAPVIEG